MDVYIGEMNSEVTALEGRGSEEPNESLLREMMQRFEARRASDSRRDDETQLWGSVRAGTGR